MTRTRILRALSLTSLLAVLSGALALAGCASTSSSGSSAVGKANAYFPLAVGNTWTYSVQPAPPDHPEETVSIVDVDDKGAFIDNRGQRLSPRSDGVFDGQRFLLQDPLEEGHKWMAIPTASTVERFRIIAVKQSVNVPAGTFEDCVEVEGVQQVKNPETGELADLVIAWTYAPGVGLVRIIQSVRSGQTARRTAEMSLVRYTVQPSAPAAGAQKPAAQ